MGERPPQQSSGPRPHRDLPQGTQGRSGTLPAAGQGAERGKRMAQSSIEQLYLTYKQDVYRYLCSLTHNTAEAEDLLSETFLRALKRLPFFRGDCAARTWLFGIARNVWLESLRKRRPALDLDDLLDWYLEDRFATDSDARETLRRVRDLLTQKDERSSRVLYMRAEGYTYAEIAARLGISENSARVIEHRTRTWLKATLQKEGYWDESK